jgi:deazaflavin-dependent oxidoreductase (nitroreductase family)
MSFSTTITTWVNNRAVNRIRKGGTFGRMRLLVLNTVGKKTGTARSNPVAWFAGENDSWLIVASAGGAPKNPGWFYNIGAHPEALSIDVGGRNVPVSAAQLEGADRALAWTSITTASPQFSKYESKTSREIPVIRLTRR